MSACYILNFKKLTFITLPDLIPLILDLSQLLFADAPMNKIHKNLF